MATSFPTSLDTFVNPTPTSDEAVLSHSSQHANINDAVAALQAKLGINSSAVTTSHDYKFANLWTLICAAYPVGTVLKYHGAIADITTKYPGFQLADGTNGTADLRDKFIVGATSDVLGVAKSNIEGSLKQTGGVTGHSHSGHANLTHSGGAVGDHTGLTHGLTIADHPDLTHPALSLPAQTITHADHSIVSKTLSGIPAITVTHADHSIASHANITAPSHSHPTLSVAVSHTLLAAYSKGATASNVVPANTGTAPISGVSMTSVAGASIAAATYTHADHSIAAQVGSIAAFTVTHADHSLASSTLAAGGTHVGSTYGSHAFTAPTAHGTAGTLTHSFTQPSDHTISAHDTVSNVVPYFALAYLEKV